MVVHMAHPVEVYSDTTRGPAHSEEIVRPHASMRSPPFPQPGHGCENESEEREKAHRRPSPTSVVSHEMSSSFVDVPGHPGAQPKDLALVGVQVIGAVKVYGVECVPPDCPAARPPPCILSSIKTVDLSTVTTKKLSKASDEFDEISPCTADEEQTSSSSVHERNSSSTESDDFHLHLAQRLAHGSAALDIQEEEDAALAQRLAAEGDWLVAYNQEFSKTDIEKGDEEFARRLYALELERGKPRPQPPRGGIRGNKIWLWTFFCIIIIAIGGWLITKYVSHDGSSDKKDVECLLASSFTTNTTSDCSEYFTTNTTETDTSEALSF